LEIKAAEIIIRLSLHHIVSCCAMLCSWEVAGSVVVRRTTWLRWSIRR